MLETAGTNAGTNAGKKAKNKPLQSITYSLRPKGELELNIIRKLLLTLAVIAIIIGALFWHYVYVPAPQEIALPGQYRSDSVSSNGLERSFSYYLPNSFRAGGGLIFVLHGSMGTGDQVRTSAGYEFDLLAESHQYIPVYADGFESHWNDCRGSADYSANTQNIDDVSYLRQLVEVFVERYKIDPDKVFITGHSNGGHMAYRVALEAPQMVRAIAPISANLPVDENLGCTKSGVPVNVAIFNGTEDPVNPYAGGLVGIMGNTSRGVVYSAAETAHYWADLAGADTAIPEVMEYPELDGDASTTVISRRWMGSDEVDVRLFTLQGSGHVIPSKRARFPRLLGPGAADISGPEEIVKFFNAVTSH